VTVLWVVLVIVLVAAIAAVGVVVSRRRPPRRDDGVASFQRHLDALSPQARRQVIDRVKKDDH
jgi:uncharacterized membrane protein